MENNTAKAKGTAKGTKKKKKGSGFQSIKTELLLLTVVPLVLITVVIGIFSRSSLRSGMSQEVLTGLKQSAMSLVAGYDLVNGDVYSLNADGDLMKGAYNITRRNEEFDEFTRGMDTALTFFYGDTRVATTLLDENGNRILGTTASDAVVEKVLKRGEEYTSTDIVINGMNYYAYYMPLKNPDGTIVGMVFAGKPSDGVTKLITQKILQVSAVSVIGAVIVAIICMMITKKLSLAINKTRQAIETLASGELSVKVDKEVLRRSDELGDMGAATNELAERLRDTIGDIQDSAKKVLASGDELGSTAEQTSRTADEISNAVEDISKGAVSQAEDIEDATTRVSEMGELIEQIVQNIGSLNNTSEEMQRTGEASTRIMRELTESNDKTVEAIRKVAENVENTDASVQKIEEAVGLITSIASQTSLLSLNASIEAARAGEAGKGFAVVASEIQKLSEESNRSAQTIADIIRVLSENSHNSIMVMEELNERLGDQQRKLEETEERFGDVSTGIVTSKEGAGQINRQAQGCDDARNRVVDIIQNLSAISEENAASTEETNASMQELNATISLLADAAGRLKELAVGLEETTRFFKL